MKKFLVCQLIIFIILLSVYPAFAHSGRTDANGGHHVTATGEYHYHHGYPAHQHPNGQCPYDFDDQTGVNSGSGGGSSNSSNNYSTAASNRSDDDSPFNIFWEHPFFSLFLIFIIGYIIKININNAIEKRKFNKEKAYYTSLYEGKTAREHANVPGNIRFDDEDLPVWADDSGLKWGKKYTVYTTRSGHCYHLKEGCCGARYARHLFRAARLSRCSKCAMGNSKNEYIPEWYKEYKKIKDIKEKYKID
jgi:hypothetical protein